MRHFTLLGGRHTQLGLSFNLSTKMDSISSTAGRDKDKVVIVMGATGTGKSKLAVHLATRFSGEIINSDKMQVYKGLDVATNKMTEIERQGIPHHIFDEMDPEVDYTVSAFCNDASCAIASIVGRGNLPIIAGGSNSFVEALVDGAKWEFRSKYDCCFLCVVVAEPVLYPFLSDRIDRMLDAGLVEEIRRIYKPKTDYSRGIRLSIGVPELDKYFRVDDRLDPGAKLELLKHAIEEMKANTYKLARGQMGKINRLSGRPGWSIQHVDATEAVARRADEGKSAEAWEEDVAEPATAMVERFLHGRRLISKKRKISGPIGGIGATTPATKIAVPALGLCATSFMAIEDCTSLT